MHDEIIAQEKKSKKLVIVWILCFFGTIFAMNFYMVYQAKTTFNGLVVEKSYQQGINYNKTLELERSIIEEGLYEDLTLSQLDKELDISLKLEHESADYSFPKYIEMFFQRPTNDKEDFKINVVKLDNSNSYNKKLDLSKIKKGVWNVEYKLYTLKGLSVKFYDRIIIK